LTAIIHLKVARWQMQKIIGPGSGEVITAMKTRGIGPTGPWFTRHPKISASDFDFEICVAVSASVLAVGRVRPGEWPAMKVIRTIYHGSYERLGAAWGNFDARIAADGYEVGKDLWGRYLLGPESGPDSASYRTELNRQLID
jgi:effector-binding domain-containing protein